MKVSVAEIDTPMYINPNSPWVRDTSFVLGVLQIAIVFALIYLIVWIIKKFSYIGVTILLSAALIVLGAWLIV